MPVLIGAAAFEEGRQRGRRIRARSDGAQAREEALMRSEAYLAETQKLTHTRHLGMGRPQPEGALLPPRKCSEFYGLDPQVDPTDPQELFGNELIPRIATG